MPCHLEGRNGGFGASTTWSVCCFRVPSRCDCLVYLGICTAIFIVLRVRERRECDHLGKIVSRYFFQSGGYCEAANAIDRRTNIGESGEVTILKCASTRVLAYSFKPLQYLQIDLLRPYSIAVVRLHLRDGKFRRRWQHGLVVTVSNSTIETNVGTQCGAYDVAKLEQSPLFPCWTSAQCVYAVLRNTRSPLQVC